MNDEKKIAIRFNEKRICRLPVIPSCNNAKIDLIAGINYIDAKYWNEIKKQTMVKIKLDNGILEEVEIEEKKETIEVKETKIVKNKDTGINEEKEVTKNVVTSISVTDFNNLKAKQKIKIIEETFSIESLEAFQKNEEDGSIRLKIEKRIDTIKNTKIDKTIDHPKSHLKV